METALAFDDIQLIPQKSYIESRKDCNIKTKLINFDIDIPIISAPMDTVTEFEMINELLRLGAVGVLHRFMGLTELENQLKNIKYDPIVISIGTSDFVRRIELGKSFGCDTFLIDVAHGHSSYMERTIKSLKDSHGEGINIIAGNIATYFAAQDLIEWGADSLRVGIGNGSLCETRIRSGVGIPQATAIRSVKEAVDFSNKPITIIADGGIRTPGDVAKAIALGADLVMLGSLLSGTKESPGSIIREGLFPDERLFKLYRGSASQSAKIARGEEDHHIEGNSKKIAYKGKVKRIVREIEDGLRSSMSYVGAKNIKEFQENADWVIVTQAGQLEAQPHLLLKDL